MLCIRRWSIGRQAAFGTVRQSEGLSTCPDWGKDNSNLENQVREIDQWVPLSHDPWHVHHCKKPRLSHAAIWIELFIHLIRVIIRFWWEKRALATSMSLKEEMWFLRLSGISSGSSVKLYTSGVHLKIRFNFRSTQGLLFL